MAAGGAAAPGRGPRAAPGPGAFVWARAPPPAERRPPPLPALPGPALPAAGSRSPPPPAPRARRPAVGSGPRGRARAGIGLLAARPGPRAPGRRARRGRRLRSRRPGAGLCCEGSRRVRPTWRRSAECGQRPALPCSPSPHGPGSGAAGAPRLPWGPCRRRPRAASPSRCGRSPHCAVVGPQPPPLFVSRGDRASRLPGRLRLLTANLALPRRRLSGTLGSFPDSPRFIT